MQGELSRILVLKEHTGTRVFNISTEEMFERVVFEIIEKKYKAGDYDIGKPPTPPELTWGETTRIKAGKVKDYALAQWQKYRADGKQYEVSQAFLDKVRACIKECDGKQAIEILESRRHLDGEDYDIYEVETSY